VIADNASTDATPAIAARLSTRCPASSRCGSSARGRGRALRAAWSSSQARVVAYMDVDLSTDLRACSRSSRRCSSGHSDLAIGTRLAHGARVVRGPKRELISRAYNSILHAVLRARFSDAQCGFKAARVGRAAAGLLDAVRDDGWFFDTELLVLAQRRGPADPRGARRLVDDPDTRVKIVAPRSRTCAARPARRRGAARALPGRSASPARSSYALLFLLLQRPARRRRRERAALAITAVGNTAANRRLTFGLRGRAACVRHHARGAAVFVLTLALTDGALNALHELDAARPSRRRADRAGDRGLRRDRDPLPRHEDVGLRARAAPGEDARRAPGARTRRALTALPLIRGRARRGPRRRRHRGRCDRRRRPWSSSRLSP
jgi:hypothetical protein